MKDLAGKTVFATGASEPFKVMIGKLNHVAIAVPDLEKAARVYRETLGARVSAPQPEPDHGVTVVFVELPNTKIELLASSGRELADRQVPGAQPRRRHAPSLLRGRGHHRRPRQLKAKGARVLGDGNPKIGAHGKPVLFLHPKDFAGTLIEIEQV